jgi:hypothetical protein
MNIPGLRCFSVRLPAILLSLVVGLTACNREKSRVAPTGQLTADEYEVLSVYLADTFTVQRVKELSSKGVIKIVVSNMTSSGDDDLLRDENGQPIPWEKTVKSLRTKAPALQQSTTDAFRKANAQQAMLRPSFHSPMDYELIDSTQFQAFFTKNGGSWPAYYKQYPGSQGIAALSRVGFSADGTQALFYLSNRCGGLCGTGTFVVMDRRDGRWTIAKQIEMWIS